MFTLPSSTITTNSASSHPQLTDTPQGPSTRTSQVHPSESSRSSVKFTSSSGSQLVTNPYVPVRVKPTTAGVATCDYSSLQLATSSIRGYSGDFAPDKPVENGAPAKTLQTTRTTKNTSSSSASLTTVQKLNSFKFVKSSNPRKRPPCDDEASTSVLPKRKSVGDGVDVSGGGATLSCQEGSSVLKSSVANFHESSRQLPRSFMRKSVTPSSTLATPPPALSTPTKSGYSSDFQTGSALTTPNQPGPSAAGPEATPSSNMTTPIKSSRTHPVRTSAHIQSGFNTPTNSVCHHNTTRVDTPTLELATSTEPSLHQSSIASVISTFRQSSSLLKSSSASDISNKNPVPMNITPVRKSVPTNSIPLRRLATNATPLHQNSVSVDSGTGGFSTPFNRPCAPPVDTNPGDKYSTPQQTSRDKYSTPQPTSRDKYLTPQLTSRDKYSTPQPTPLICTPSSGAGPSGGVDILSTPVVLAKRKFPGPAGLLPPLVSMYICTYIHLQD